MIVELDLRGNLVADAALAALCLEHGLQMVSADSEFSRFTELDWLNPRQALIGAPVRAPNGSVSCLGSHPGAHPDPARGQQNGPS